MAGAILTTQPLAAIKTRARVGSCSVGRLSVLTFVLVLVFFLIFELSLVFEDRERELTTRSRRARGLFSVAFGPRRASERLKVRGPSFLVRSCTTVACNSALPARSFQFAQSKLARAPDDFQSRGTEQEGPARTTYSSRCKRRPNHGSFERWTAPGTGVPNSRPRANRGGSALGGNASL